MKKLILMLLLIGLFCSYASADPNDLRKLIEERRASMTEEERAEADARVLKQNFKAQYREERQVMQAMTEAQEEVDAEAAIEEAPIPEEDEGSFFQIDETTLYYMFSTIAQTLAGAFGILGVFAMYKLQSINDSRKGVGDAIIQSLHFQKDHLPEVHINYSQENWELFGKSITKYMEEDDNGTPKLLRVYPMPKQRILMYCLVLNVLTISHNEIKKQILSALKLTVITISFSLVVLPFSTAVAHYQSLTTVLTATVIMLSIKCLLDYSALVLNALGISDKRKKKDIQRTNSETSDEK